MSVQGTRLRAVALHISLIIATLVALFPLPETTAAHVLTPKRILTPKKTTATYATPANESDYYVVFGQSKTTTSRTVVLNWSSAPNGISTYKIYRRTVPGVADTLVGTTGIVQSSSDLSTMLGTDVQSRLSVALNTTGLMTDTLSISQLYDTFLNLNQVSTPAETITKTVIAAQRYPELANALGLGFTDTMSTNLTSVLRYTVKEAVIISDVLTEITVGSVTISPDGRTTTIPTPSNLREAGVYDGPGDLGIINSRRIITAAERYDAQIMQSEINNDGKVYLIWDKGRTLAVNRMVRGYNVYRRLPTGVIASWTKLNTNPVTMTASQPYAPSRFTQADGRTYASFYDDPYFFIDDSSGFSSTYRSWSYRVCAVDLAGTEGACSASVTAVKRDLTPPTDVTNLTAASVYPAPGSRVPSSVRLTWSYADAAQLMPSNGGDLPKFFITRAITTGIRLNNWTVVASNIASTSAVTATYVFTDTPPINTMYWYRIQVRDNAGNWSAASTPVKGAVYDRLPPAKPVLASPQMKRPCYDKLPPRLRVTSDVKQVVLSRRLSQAGEWRIVRRLRPNTARGNPLGVDIVDKYVTPLPNTPVYYKIEYFDAYGNVSEPAVLCVRGNSPNDLVPPRFRVNIGNNENGAMRTVTVDFGGTTDIFSRTVVIARPTSTNPVAVTNNVVPGNASTYSFQIDVGESLRVGAVASALTATTTLSTTLNSRWLRNVNNFLNLNANPAATTFLDTPRNMTNLGTLSVMRSSRNNESCTETSTSPMKVCATISNTGYLKNEKPPMVALFRRIVPSVIGTQAANSVPWIQVTPITEWTLKGRMYIVEDTTVFDPSRSYEYMAVAHSSTSYEVIGYFGATTLIGLKPTSTVVDIGMPATISTVPNALPARCIVSGMLATAEYLEINESNLSALPPYFADENGDVSNTFSLGNNFTFTADKIIRAKTSTCAIVDPATTNKELYLVGTVSAGSRIVNSNVAVYRAALSAPGVFESTSFVVPFPPAAAVSSITSLDANGFTVKIRDLVYQVNATGIMTSTTALTVTLPAHLRIAVDTTEPIRSQRRAGTVVLHTTVLDGNYDVDGFVDDITSNAPFSFAASSTQRGAVIIDEFSPWFYRIGGLVRIVADASALSFDAVQAFSRTTYTYSSAQYTNLVPDNNAAFTGTFGSGGRDYVYDSADTTITMGGVQANLLRTSGISYVTSYPAGIQIEALGGAAFKLTDSVITTGMLITPTVRMKHMIRDSDTSYAKVISGRPVFMRGHYLAIDKLFTYVPTNTTQLITIDTADTMSFGEAGTMIAPVSTSDTIRWPGFTMEPMSDTVDMTLYLAPATPIGMSSTYNTIPEPAESAWEQIDLGYSDESDLDPGLNFNGENTVKYACYGTGVFSAKMDTYLRYGGFSEHLILQGLGDTVKNNMTGYDESLTKFSAIFADNVIVDPSDVESELILPYPSDVTLPLNSNIFDGNGCPVGGEIGGGGGSNLNHRYWNFSQQALTYGYASGVTLSRYVTQYLVSNGLPNNSTNVALARTKLPAVILQIGGNMQPLAARNQANSQASIAGISEWLPNGEFGNVTLTAPVEIFNSGMPFTLNDIILNRYSDKFLEAGDPSTAGFGPKVSGLPSKLLDPDTGELTQTSLSACISATSEPLGCGLQILDGNNSLKYFGEPETCGPSSGVTCVSPAGTTMLPRDFLQSRSGGSNTPTGDGSIGSAGDGSDEGDTLWNPVLVQFMWDLGGAALDIPIPLVFIANKSGGVFAGMFKKQSLLPGTAEVFQTDISVVVNGRLSASVFTTDIGIFFGYAASQASLRALATHRPNNDNSGFEAHEPFSVVKDDVKKWSKAFGYGNYDNSNDNDDPVDMLEDMWTGHTVNSTTYTWANVQDGNPSKSSLHDYQNVFKFLEPKLKASLATESYNDATQGITPLKQGTVLANACTTMKNGHGAAQFQLVGTDFYVKEIAFGTYIDIKNTASSSSCDTGGDSLLTIDRVSVYITGDGEITILGNHVKTEILERNVEFDVQLVIGTSAGNQRIEGGLKLYALKVASVDFTNIGVVFGVGQYNSQRIGYFGFGGTGKFKGYSVSASFVFGMLSPSSAVLRAQYGSLMTKLAADKGSASVFSGVYISVGIEVPIYTDGCMREVKANGELRGWYFKQISPPSGTPISWGGYISAGVYGEAACLVSARGQLSLELYETTGILHFDGQAWLAGGVGDCEPNTWNSWGGRWWGDSWCAQAGAMVQVNYAENSGWDVDYDLAVESVW
ncbi:MAG: hypothetical protein ACK5C8_05035 [Roseiflexaceae bacterium]